MLCESPRHGPMVLAVRGRRGSVIVWDAIDRFGGCGKGLVAIGRHAAIEINVADVTGRREMGIWEHSGDTAISFERKGAVRSSERL
jgi:hypothetical protein